MNFNINNMKTNIGVSNGSDFLPYDRCLNEGMRLINGDNPQKRIIGLYIVLSINLGLRISDILALTWQQIKMDQFTIKERKTGKSRTLVVNSHIKNAVKLFDEQSSGLIFISQKKTVFAIQTINTLLKEVFARENKTLRISSHSLRKSFSLAVYDKLGQTENALVYLSELLNHTSLKVTRVYLGIRQQELNNIYLSL